MEIDNTIGIKKTIFVFTSNSFLQKTSERSTTGIITFILNAAVALVLLIGNSSFTLLTYGQGVDSAKILSFDDSKEFNDKKEVKISIPTPKMIRRADIEMNRNMNEWIKMINLFKISQFDPFYGDKQINNNFFKTFYLCFNVSDSDENRLHMFFKAENIKIVGMKSFLESDIIIDNSFKCSYYINHNSSTLVEADSLINSSFRAENP